MIIFQIINKTKEENVITFTIGVKRVDYNKTKNSLNRYETLI